jgi:serine/threonine-protein kinase
VVGGKYRVERVVGAGGMGVVVAATQIDLERPVALKFLLPRVLARADCAARFSREARAAARLQSEHVARVLDVGQLPDGAPYLVMEFLSGMDMAALLKAHGPLPSVEAVRFLLEAIEAIAEAHRAGIVHRDLKPSNIFLADRTNGAAIIKVLDFGLSKFSDNPEENLTSESSVMGSPLYMPPEQLLSTHHADERSDIWSLGVVLYELLTGTTPFRAAQMPELVAAILQKAPQPFDPEQAPVPASLQAVVFRCLEKNPAQRFADVGQLAAALASFGPPRSTRAVDRILHTLRPGSDKEPPRAEPLAESHAPGAMIASNPMLRSSPPVAAPEAPGVGSKRAIVRRNALTAVGAFVAVAAVAAVGARWRTGSPVSGAATEHAIQSGVPAAIGATDSPVGPPSQHARDPALGPSDSGTEIAAQGDSGRVERPPSETDKRSGRRIPQPDLERRSAGSATRVGDGGDGNREDAAVQGTPPPSAQPRPPAADPLSGLHLL